MSLRRKALLVSGAILASLLIASYFIQEIVLSDSFARLEERVMRENTARAVNALAVDLAQLASAASDWAWWDDTYAFVEDGNAEYVKANLNGSAFTNLKLNLMVFVHSSGRVVIARGYDLSSQTEVPAPASLAEHLTRDSLLLNHPDDKSGAQGVVVLPEGPLLIAALPILTSQDEGPSRGTLIFGRWLNPAEIAHLAQITHLTLAIHRLDSAALPADVQTARATLSEQTPIAVRPLNEQTVAGYALVKDIYDRPALVLRAESARDIHQQGNLSKTYLIALSLGAGIVGYALITFGIERLVLSRIAHLSQNVRRVGADGDPARRVFARGDDEIFSLAREINRMLEAIQTSERRYRALFEGAPMIIYALDSAGRFTALNPAFEQITGWTSAEWLGRSFTEIVPPQDVPEMQQVFQQALHGELLQYAERRILSKTGEVVTVDLLGLPQMENDQVVGVAGFALDITERKRAADALRESEQKYRTLVENINEVIYTLDLDGRFTYVSPVVERLSAYKMENLLGRRFTDFVHPDDLPGLLESYSRTLRGEIEPFEYRIFDKNGQVRYIRSSSRLIVKDAAVVGISGVMSDITARKNAEAALRESEERYRDLVEHSHALICTHDLQGRFLSTNQWALDLLGYAPTAVAQVNLRDLLAPEVRDQMDEYLTRIQRDGSAHGVMVVQTRAGEKRIWEYHNTLRTEGVAEPIVRGIAHDVTEQKQLERALRESEERWRTYIEQANDLIFALDAAGRFTLVNRAACAALGYNEAELRGQSPLTFIAPETREAARVALKRVLSGEDIERFELEALTRDQRRIALEVRGRILRRDGHITGTFHIARDISERKHAEEKLRRSRKEWQDIFSAVSHPTFILDPQHGVSAANPAVLKQLGKSEAQVIGQRCYHLFHHADCAPTNCPMETMLRSGKPETVEMEMRAAGGTYLVSCTPVLDEHGQLEKVIHIATDITERKRAEDELNQSHSLLQAAFDSTADGFLVVDLQGKITQFNRKFAEMWRIPPEILATGEDTKALAFVLEQLSEPDEFIRKVQELYAQPAAESFDVLRFKDGRVFERYSQPHHLGKQIVGRVWSFRDATERKRAEAALKEYSERLEQMVEARTRELRDAQEQLIRQERLAVLGQLAGGIAHELRSPLSAIKNAAYYFKMVVENPSADAREMLGILDQQIDVSARIIGSLLDFARPKTCNLQATQLTRVIEAAICRCNIPQNITVVWEADESLPPLTVDAEQMQLVFGNLITNAAQAMPQGGQLTIATQLGDAAMQVTVSDTGVGIAPDALDKVFQPLYTTKAKGIGLGLALCRIIVEAHGGTIAVTSEVGTGTTFVVALPREQVQEQ